MAEPLDPMMAAAYDLLRRTGATAVQLRYSDDEKPVVWIAVAEYANGAEAAASLDPVRAVLRLCERLVDGGLCTHCRRPTAFEADSIETPPLNEFVCWCQYDPELATFRRACEGELR